MKAEAGDEIMKLKRDVEKSNQESRELALKAEMGKLQVEEEAKQQTLKLSEQLEEMQKNRAVEVCCTEM